MVASVPILIKHYRVYTSNFGHPFGVGKSQRGVYKDEVSEWT